MLMNGLLNQRLIETGEYCYFNFLSKKYELTQSEKFPREGSINGHVIQRPNHGLAHTLRKIYYFPSVVAAFKLNGITTFIFKNKEYYIERERENILTAFFFSVIGRESEASHKNDPKNYALFRQKSADSYENYILSRKNKTSQDLELISSERVIFYKKMILAPHDNHKCIISRIFRICHCLDLLRCYTETEYSAARESIQSDLGIGEGKTQPGPIEIVSQLKKYAAKCIQATGDKNLVLNIPRNNELFVACSISVKSCSGYLEKVSPPNFYLPKLKKTNVQPVPIKQANPVPILAKQAIPLPKVKEIPNDMQIQYERGKALYLQKNYEAALSEFRASVTMKFDKGQYMMGICYYYGQGVQVNYQKALDYFQLAANQKHPNALYMVGICIKGGFGCTKDLALAKQYFESAAKHGSQDAIKILQM